MDTRNKIKSKFLSNRKNIRLDFFIKNALFDKKNGYYYKKKPIGKKK